MLSEKKVVKWVALFLALMFMVPLSSMTGSAASGYEEWDEFLKAYLGV